MNANKLTATDLAECLEDYSVIKESPFSQIIGKKSAEMLRKQDAAIKQLRAALELIDDASMGGSRFEALCRNALAATEEFAK